MLINPANIFGSKVDWINQHTVFPDYFRKLFYQTGDLIPNFAEQLGGGQNIFNFSYYGLLNPIILISYFLPFLSMTNYILIANIVLIILSGLLLYKWLKAHSNNQNVAFISTLIVILSASFIFQFHRHFMFVSYMPFLIGGLIGIDRYFEKNTHWIYALCTFFMIMTSYYYSIVGIIIFVLYGINRYIKRTNHITFKKFIHDGFLFAIPIIIGVLMAGLILLPTMHVILAGRGDAGMIVTLKDLFLPKMNIEAIVYDPYTLGLTSIAVISIVYLAFMSKKPERRFLNWALLLILLFPIFIYLLNGTLYIRNKIFIPFLPIMGYFISKFISNLFDDKVDMKKLSMIFVIFIILLLITGYSMPIFYLDLLITLLSLFAYDKWKKKSYFLIPLFLIVLLNLVITTQGETFVTKKKYQDIFAKEKEVMVRETLEKEDSIVRFHNLNDTLYTINKIYQTDYYQDSLYSSTYNKDYNDFYKYTFQNALPYRNKLILAQNNNIMYQTFMGVKYVMTSDTPGIGYHLVTENKNSDAKVYQNDSVLPIGYATNHILNEAEFDKLNYPVTNQLLIGQAVVSKKSQNTIHPNIKEITPAYETKGLEKLSIQKKEDGSYHIVAKKNTTFEIDLKEAIQKQILFIEFNIDNWQHCTEGDQKITINGTMNKLTCQEWQYENGNHTFHYVLSQNDAFNRLNITMEKGTYDISNIHLYTLDYDIVTNQVKDVDAFQIDKDKTVGDVITGDINVTTDGYFVTSIPYDEGFTVFVDEKEIKYEKVNKAFLGFPISKGNHHIVIEYHAPLADIGMMITLFGSTLFLFLLIYDLKQMLKENEKRL